MKTSKCGSCGNKVYFENVLCVRCGHALGFDSARLQMATLEPAADGLFRRIDMRSAKRFRYCKNAEHGACNWITAADSPTGLCLACAMNRTIPNLSLPGNLKAWQDFERAKKRLVYQVLRFTLPLDGFSVGKARMIFDFAHATTTGHMGGAISVDMMEADSVWREQQRQMFEEPYRSLLGHLRHEAGHFYWMLLIDGTPKADEFRATFGDEREDYLTALNSFRMNGPPADWQESNVSAYASAHAWEDWAETWAHYLHMVDALETAETWALEPRASGLILGSLWPFKSYDVYREETFDALMERWVPLTLALNSMSRSMGHIDFYPFVITNAVSDKLRFVHDIIRANATG